jgi:cardiolipin synthase
VEHPEAISDTAGHDAAHAPPSMLSGIWTIPNAFTLVRLLCLPVFLYVLFEIEDRAVAALILGALGATDWIDGYLARRLGQVSEFGKVFDPTVDRLMFVVATTAIIIDGSIPLWFAVAVLAREVAVGAMMAVATVVYKMPRIDVTYWGKLATFLLMFAVPGFLMGNSDIAAASWFEALAWLLGVPGLVLSYWTAIAYIPQVRHAVAAGRVARSPERPPSP